MLFSLCFHEAAHALSAKVCGDKTAERLGRLTLNPIAHADLLGTVILPLAGLLAQLPVLGWAKPVPVDERNFRRWPRVSHAFVSFAGPLSNLILCLVCIVALTIYHLFLGSLVTKGSFLFPLVGLVEAMVWVNAILAVFNMIPLPPLDGAAVLQLVLPRDLADAYERLVAPSGFIILMVLMVTGGLAWIQFVARAYVQLCGSLVETVAGLLMAG